MNETNGLDPDENSPGRVSRSKRLNVAIIGTRGYPSYYGGFETAIRKLAPYLADKGWDVTVYGRPGTTREDDPDLDNRIRTLTTLGFETRTLSTLSYGLTSCLHAYVTKPDVALIMNVANGFWLPFLKMRGIKTLVNVDGIEWDRAKWSRLAKAIFRAGAWMTAKFADEIIVDSKEIGRRWKKRFDRDGIFIPYGGDIPEALPLEPGLAHLAYVLVVARFVPENTVPEFVAAAVELAQEWPIVIVGSSGYGGEIEDAIQSLAVSSPNVTWLGHVSDDKRLLSLWQHAGVYFHGHSVGGTNPALVQAMACGANIVARDTVYNREVLGANSTFVEPTPGAIRDSLHKAMLNRGGYSSENITRVRDHYSWANVCRDYETHLSANLRNAL